VEQLIGLVAAPFRVDDQIDFQSFGTGAVLVIANPLEPVHRLRVLEVHREMLANEILVRIVDGHARKRNLRSLQLLKDQAMGHVVVAVVLAVGPAGVIGDIAPVAPVGEISQMPEANLRVCAVECADRIDDLVDGLFNRLEPLAIAATVGMREPANGAVEVEEVDLASGGIQLVDLGQFGSRRPLAVGVVHGAEIEAAAQFDGYQIVVLAGQSDHGGQLLGRGVVDLVDVELDARKVTLHERPFRAGLKEFRDPLTGAEPDLGLGHGRGRISRQCQARQSQRQEDRTETEYPGMGSHHRQLLPSTIVPARDGKREP